LPDRKAFAAKEKIHDLIAFYDNQDMNSFVNPFQLDYLKFPTFRINFSMRIQNNQLLFS